MTEEFDQIATDSCEFYSKHIQQTTFNGVPLQDYITDNDTVADSLTTWLTEYKQGNLTPQRKEDLQTKVLSSTFYLILHELKNWNLQSSIFEEAVQNSCIAVIKAMDRFDPSLNVRFSTYIIQWQVIKTAIRDSIEIQPVVRIPSSVRKRDARKAKELVYCGEEPSSIKFGDHVISLEQQQKKPSAPETPAYNFSGEEYLEDLSYAKHEADPDSDQDEDVEKRLFTKEIREMCEIALDTGAAKLTQNEKITLKHKHGLLNAPVLRNKEIAGIIRAKVMAAKRAKVYGWFTGHFLAYTSKDNREFFKRLTTKVEQVSTARVCQYNNNGMAKMRQWLLDHNDGMFGSLRYS